MNAGTITVILKAVDDNFKKGLKDAAEASKKAAAAFAVMGAGIALAFKEAAEAEANIVRLGAAAKAAGTSMDVGRMEAFASALESVTTFSDDAIIASGTMLTSFGLQQGQIESLTPRIADFAALMGTDLETAATAVGRSIQSGTNALQRQGLVMTDGQQRTFEAASETERLSMMMGLLRQKADGVAQTMANTSSGAIAQFMNAINNLGEEIGKMVKGPVTDMKRDMMDAISRVTTLIKQLDPETKNMIGQFMLGATAAAGVATALLGIAAVVPAIVSGLALIAGAAWPIVAGTLLIVGALAGIILGIGLVKKAWDSDFGYIRSSITALVEFANKAWRWWVDNSVALVHWLVSKFDSAFGTDLAGMFADTSDSLASSMDDAWTKIKDGAEDTAAFVKDSLLEGLSAIGIDSAVIEKIKKMVADFQKIKVPHGGGPKGGKGAVPIETAAPGDKGEMVGPQLPGGLTDYARGEGQDVALAQAKKNQSDYLTAQAGQATNAALDNIGEAGSIIASEFEGKMGKAGDAMSAAMKGFEAGGPMGAAIAVIGQLITSTEAFAKIISMFDEIMQQLSDSLNPLIASVIPLIQIAFTALAPLLNLLGAALSFVASIISKVVSGIAGVWNSILGAIASFLDKIGKIKVFGKHPFGKLSEWADDIRDSQISLGGFSDSLDALLAAQGEGADSVDDMANAADKATAALSNIPSGYKIALARFNAMDAQRMGGGSSYPQARTDGALAQTTNIGTVQIVASNPERMYEQWKRMVEKDNFMKGGSPTAHGPFATAKAR